MRKLRTPFSLGFRQCAEFSRQKVVWLAWPWDEQLWVDQLNGAQWAITQLVEALQTGGCKVHLLVPDATWKKKAAKTLGDRGNGVQYFEIPYGDIWLRDIAPIFVQNANHENAAICFHFNGWGEKYILPGDAEVAFSLARATRYPTFPCDMVLEGGAIEPNGQGLAFTTRQCLLNPNRNPHFSQRDVEKLLEDFLGIEHLIWLEKGLLHDHTDGHIDNIVRFVSPETLICMESRIPGDPQKEVLDGILLALKSARTPHPRRLEVLTVPSPGEVQGPDGEIMPASYLNFLLTNDTVILPVFGVKQDDLAVKEFQRIFVGKRIIPIDCRDLLSGGGSIHCITQPEFV